MRNGIKLFILLCFASAIGLSALPDDSYSFTGGVSSFRQEISNDTSGTVRDSLMGTYVGAFGERYISTSWVFSPGVFLSQKGVQNSASFTRATYLETSAQLRWYFADKPRWRSYFGFGAGYGILLDAETVTSGGQTSNAWQNLNKNELSAQLGAGFEFPVSSSTGLQFGCTYSRGLTNNLSPATSSGADGKWTGIYAFVALRFKTKDESYGPQERALDYLKWKNEGFNGQWRREEKEEQSPVSKESEKLNQNQERFPQAKHEDLVEDQDVKPDPELLLQNEEPPNLAPAEPVQPMKEEW